MSRRAPAAGYDFGNKRQYRRSVWRTFRTETLLTYGTLNSAQCALLPSSEGTEIDVAIANGFLPQNLHIIDREPAIIARLRRKDRYPLTTGYGAEVEEALSRIAHRGVRLTCANLDLTAPISEKTHEVLYACSAAGAFRDGALVGVTVLRGRERGFFRDEMYEDAETGVSKWIGGDRDPRDRARLGMVAFALSMEWRLAIDLVRADTYRSISGNQTMLWSIWKLSDHTKEH